MKTLLVIALADAHTTGDRPHLSTAQIVEHDNWVWANLAAPAGSALTVQALAHMRDADVARETTAPMARHP